MSMIFQSYAVWPHMTVSQNVAYGLKFKKWPRHEIDQKIAKALRLVHLESLKDRYPSELSGGQQQRVALARALVVEPEILLMDEPLSNLDANLREEMRFEIRRLHEEFAITTVTSPMTKPRRWRHPAASPFSTRKAGAGRQARGDFRSTAHAFRRRVRWQSQHFDRGVDRQ
jgi:ABC-type polar amino acid transport system ATPase subunit